MNIWKRFLFWIGLLLATGLPLHAGGAPPTDTPDWPQFRGPDGQGHAHTRGLALAWSEKENITWKVEIPGLGWSSPAIQGQQIWLTTAIHEKPSLRALCLDRATGRRLHDVEVFAPKRLVPRHEKNSFATPTPLIEKDRVYVHFGQMGTACLSTEGKVVWTAVLPHNLYYGPSSSPVLFDDLLIVPCQGTDVRYLVALDEQTGKERWKTSCGGPYNSDSTPLVIRVGKVDQLVCNLTGSVAAFDPRTGKELWSVANGNVAQVPRPVFGHGLIYACGGYFNPIVQAIRPDGKGDVTRSHVVWSRRKQVPQNPSPLLVGDELYLVSDAGIASCLDARTGKEHWSERLAGTYSASPLSADGRIYYSNEDGVTTVLAPGTTFQKQATNRLDGRTQASLAVAGKEIYLRTDRHVYRIEQPAKPPAALEHIPARADEPLAKAFSLKQAARSLDSSALHWQKQNQCCQCHANFLYLVARPALGDVVPPAKEVRELFESLVRERWEKHGLRYPSEAMVVAVPLAFNDRQTTGKLHPLTRKALDRMLTHQRPDGGWNGIGGSERTFINEFEETLFAALGIAVAPDGYARTPAASKALEKIRGYVKTHPPRTPYQKAMLLWAAHHVEGLMGEPDRKKAIEELLALQRDDGGWTLQELLEDDRDWQRGRFARSLPSDGYGTGFVIFVLRQADVRADTPQLKRGIAWLKANQRASGRWFTPTASRRTLNLPSNSGTGYAILALEACGEIPSPKKP